MGFMDKITGRAKKAAGDVTGNTTMRQQGRKEEEKGEAKESQARAEEKAQSEKERADDLKRRT